MYINKFKIFVIFFFFGVVVVVIFRILLIRHHTHKSLYTPSLYRQGSKAKHVGSNVMVDIPRVDNIWNIEFWRKPIIVIDLSRRWIQNGIAFVTDSLMCRYGFFKLTGKKKFLLYIFFFNWVQQGIFLYW